MRKIRVLSCVLLLALLNTALADGLEMPTVQENNEVFNGNQDIEPDGIEVYSLRTDLESQEGFYDELNSGLGEILPDIELEIEQPEAQAVEGEQTDGLVTSAIIDATTVTAYYEGHGYRIFNEALTWTEAKAACEAKGGHLATITGKGENYFVKSLIEANPAKDKYHFWLGGTDAAEEGTWRWITGEAWNYTAWESGQPNNSKEHDPEGQDYLEIYRLPDYGCQWNDEPNDGYSPYSPEGPDYYSLPYYGYVCEWDGERDESPCGKLQRYKGNRYQVFNAAMTWKQAEAACEKAGGHLVVITSEDENSFIKELILSNPASGKYHYWIGGSDSEKEGVWQWVTGEPWDYTYWEPGQPNNDTAHDSTGQDYLEFNNIPGYAPMWNDEPNDGCSPYSPDAPDYLSKPYYGYICEWEGEAKSLKKAVVTPGYTETVYNGKAKKPSVTVKLDGKTLKKNTDYRVTYKNNTKIGTATVKVTGIGSYKGSASATFRIVPATPKLSVSSKNSGEALLKASEVKGATGYDFRWRKSGESSEKKQLSADLTRTLSGLSRGVEYTFRVRAYAAVQGKNVYGDFSKSKKVKIYKGKDLSKCELIVDDGAAVLYVYTGKQIKPAVKVKSGLFTLKKDKDYTVTYKDNINSGTAKLTVTGIGKYYGTLKKNFVIGMAPLKAEYFGLKTTSYTYDGKEKKPVIIASFNKMAMTAGKDYRASYSANTDAGEAKVTLKGLGNFTGTVSKTFTIKPLKLSACKVSLPDGDSYAYTGEAIEPRVEVKKGKTVLPSSDYDVSYADNTEIGQASAVVTGKGNITGQNIIGFEIVKQFVSPVPAGCRFTKKSGDGKWFGHHDININVNEKTPVYAIANGYVVCSQKYTVEGGQKYLVSYGNCINFTSDDINGKTYTAVYAHLSRYAVPGVEQVIPSSSTKQLSSKECHCQTEYLNDGKAVRVKVGDIIGYIGTTGNSTGNHLHFEVYENGKRLDPVDLFPELK